MTEAKEQACDLLVNGGGIRGISLAVECGKDFTIKFLLIFIGIVLFCLRGLGGEQGVSLPTLNYSPRNDGHMPIVNPFSPNTDASLSSTRYLFLDPEILIECRGAEFRINAPQRRETVIIPDRPWEQLMITFWLTVRDEAGKLRMWYTCRDKENQPNVAYAESTDGVLWTKPNLGVYEYNGSKENNLVGLQDLSGVFFKDPNMPAEERYIYVSTSRPSGKPANRKMIYRFHSPDGLNWKRDDVPLIRASADTQNVVWWDEGRREYVIYLRGWTPSPPRRKVVRLSLSSLKKPSDLALSGHGFRQYFDNEIPTVLQCDEQDPVRTDIYNMSAQPYAVDPSWYVAFPTFLRRSPETAAPGYKGRHIGPAEVQFAGSHDSIKWYRYDRSAYVSPPLVDPDQRNMVFMGTGMVVRGNELWQYATEFHSRHGDVSARYKRTDGFIVRYVQRIDGFVSLDTGIAMGTVRTKAVVVSGKRLLLNVDTGALGEIRVGLVDVNGNAFPGFGLDDCKPFTGNTTSGIVSWQMDKDLGALKGKQVWLVMESTRTKLFSFRFQ